MALFNFPYATIFDTNGELAPGAKAYFYIAGTSTPLDTYSDPDLVTANTNPVIANGAGALGPIYLKPQSYKVIIKDASDSTIKTVDDYSPIPTGEQIIWAGTVGGTANSVLLTTDPLVQSLRDGTMFWWRSASANTTAMTINLDGTGNKSLVWPDGTAMLPGDVPAAAIVLMAHDADNDVFNLLSNTAGPLFRTQLDADIKQNASGDLIATQPVITKNNIDYTVLTTDRNKVIQSVSTSTTRVMTMPTAAGATADWSVTIMNVAQSTYTTTIAATTGNFFGAGYSNATTITLLPGESMTLESNGSAFYVTNYVRLNIAGRFLARQTFTSSGTYTPNSRMAFCDVTILGGGGAGGSVNSTARAAGGSGAGVKVRFTDVQIGASKAVTIGAGGTGVSSGVGNPGNSSSLGTLVVVGGGAGGTVSSVGGAGGTVSTSGTINVNGRSGSGQSSSVVNDTKGGDSPFGLGTGGEGLSSGNGVAGSGYGSGGSAASTGTSGAGGAGICIIEEYS